VLQIISGLHVGFHVRAGVLVRFHVLAHVIARLTRVERILGLLGLQLVLVGELSLTLVVPPHFMDSVESDVVLGYRCNFDLPWMVAEMCRRLPLSLMLMSASWIQV
jgi:hypothetical protein